jgi:hypothetical protein
MKKVFLVILIGLSISAGVAQKRSSHDSIRYFLIQPSVGYTTLALGDVNDFYDEVILMYGEYGLDIPTQQQYPGSIVVGLNGLYNVPSVLRVGIGSQYTRTKSYSGYEDYAGLLEIKSTISMLTLEGIAERDIETFKAGTLYVGARGGFSFVNSDYTNEISFNKYPGGAEEITLSGDGHGFTIEPYIGFQRIVGNFSIGLTAGYRFAKVKKLDGEMYIPGEGNYSGELDLEHDLSGVSLNAKIGYRFMSN